MKNIFNHGKVILLFTAFLILTVADVLVSSMPTTTTLSTGTRQSVIAQATTDDTIRVDAGGGNATGPLTVYVPQNVTVEAGQSIYWINPTTVESHILSPL
jgi:plastocyanin